MCGETDVTERLLYADRLVRISLREGTSGPLLVLAGEIDVTNSGDVATALASCRAGQGRITADIGAVTFMDLSGLRVLLLPALPPAQRWIRLRNVTPYQKRLLGLLGWWHQPSPIT